MRRSRHRRSNRRGDQGGQAVIEFALIAPVALMLLFGIISSCYLFYQSSSLHDGASAGARAASIETSLVQKTGAQYCETGLPVSIEQAVASSAPYLAVNMTSLCGTSSGSDGTGVTQLTQTIAAGKVNITVTCASNCSAPSTVAVALTYNANGIALPLKLTYTLKASSKVPVLAP